MSGEAVILCTVRKYVKNVVKGSAYTYLRQFYCNGVEDPYEYEIANLLYE